MQIEYLICAGEISYVNLANLWSPPILSNNNLDVAVKVFCTLN